MARISTEIQRHASTVSAFRSDPCRIERGVGASNTDAIDIAAYGQLPAIDVDNAYMGLRLDQFSMMVAAVAAGLGVALLPTYLVEEELASGAFVALLPLPMQPKTLTQLAWSRSKANMADAFKAWLLKEVSLPQ